ncbi:P-II family nitrogen regulator [Myxococcus xanthus]|nr:P-II family nitrogen regulator [Myxococcus xanthus]
MLLLVVPDALVNTVLTTIQQHAHTGNIGDGKVFVSPIEDALHLRTGQRGDVVL